MFTTAFCIRVVTTVSVSALKSLNVVDITCCRVRVEFKLLTLSSAFRRKRRDDLNVPSMRTNNDAISKLINSKLNADENSLILY
jgi:hypothetical protein